MKTTLRIVCAFIVVASVLYALQTERKYELLNNEVNVIQASELAAIKNQTASIQYRLEAIIKDNKLEESEVVPLAFIIEEFRDLITPYAVLSNIDHHSVENVYPELNADFDTAWNQVNVAPRYASVDDIEQMIEALDVFMAKVQYLYETHR